MIVKDVTQLVLVRRTKMCNFLGYESTWISSSLGTEFRPLGVWILGIFIV